MARKILILAFLASGVFANAQTVLLDVDRQTEQIESRRGPNMKRFSHMVIHAGAVVSGDKAGARIVYGGSSDFAFGVRKKFKVTPTYSFGYDIENQYTFYKLKQEQGKILPDTTINNISGRLDYSSLGLGFYNRINFDPSRGNFLGRFLDIGIMGEWDYSIKTVAKNKLPDGTILKSVIRNLNFVNNLNAKVYMRVGFSHLSLFVNYRLTALFKSGKNFPDLPRMSTGLELALF